MKKYIIIVVFALGAWNMSFGQALRTSFFMDKYTHNHLFNPSISPTWGYLYIPGVGPFSVELESNMRLSNFLFPKGDELLTFLHPDVSSSDFMSKIKDNNRLGFGLNYNLLSFGFYTGQSSFWSFDAGLKVNSNLHLPRDFFALFKNGMSTTDTRYQLGKLGMQADVYLEAALGFASNVDDNLRLGGKLKFLVGAAGLKFEVDDMQVHMTPDAWTIDSKASLALYGAGLRLASDTSGIPSLEMDGYTPAPGGYGVAIDFGASYSFSEDAFLSGLTLSAAMVDLGFIRYRAANISRLEAKGRVVYDGFSNIDANLNIDDQMQKLQDEFMKLIDFKEVPSSKGEMRYLRSTINLGAEYAIWNNRFSVGVLSTNRINYGKMLSELTLSANLRPASWFAATVSYSFLQSRFKTIGWALHFTPKWGLNLFLGSDYTFFAVTPQYVPIHTSNFNFHFGLSIPLGNNRKASYVMAESVEE